MSKHVQARHSSSADNLTSAHSEAQLSSRPFGEESEQVEESKPESKSFSGATGATASSPPSGNGSTSPGFSFLDMPLHAEEAEVQTKLTIGEPGDKYEQEADSMAAHVMRMPKPESQALAENGQKSEAQIQHFNLGIGNELSKKESSIQRNQGNEQTEAGTNLESRLESQRGSGNPLPEDVRSFMEPRFGSDFSDVKVHTDSSAVQMNKELGAQAFTYGSEIYYGDGNNPGKNELTAHELTHVVQQTGELHRDTSQLLSTDEFNEGELASEITPEPTHSDEALGSPWAQASLRLADFTRRSTRATLLLNGARDHYTSWMLDVCTVYSEAWSNHTDRLNEDDQRARLVDELILNATIGTLTAGTASAGGFLIKEVFKAADTAEEFVVGAIASYGSTSANAFKLIPEESSALKKYPTNPFEWGSHNQSRVHKEFSQMSFELSNLINEANIELIEEQRVALLREVSATLLQEQNTSHQQEQINDNQQEENRDFLPLSEIASENGEANAINEPQAFNERTQQLQDINLGLDDTNSDLRFRPDDLVIQELNLKVEEGSDEVTGVDIKDVDWKKLAEEIEKGFWKEWLKKYSYVVEGDPEDWNVKNNIDGMKASKKRCDYLGVNWKAYAKDSETQAWQKVRQAWEEDTNQGLSWNDEHETYEETEYK